MNDLYYSLNKIYNIFIKEYSYIMKNDVINDLHYNLNEIYKSNDEFLKLIYCNRFFRLLNKNKYMLFSFSDKKIWNTLYLKKQQLIHKLQNHLENNHTEINGIFNCISFKYLTLKNRELYYKYTLNNINKYPAKYGEFIGLVLYRLFCTNIAFHIRDYI
uniref:Uncharacterized protein n=1 Tax=Florenciella sp. virus SA2 TaxID=3240092 RepID=A0AB39JFI1_9VIRU